MQVAQYVFLVVISQVAVMPKEIKQCTNYDREEEEDSNLINTVVNSVYWTTHNTFW